MAGLLDLETPGSPAVSRHDDSPSAVPPSCGCRGDGGPSSESSLAHQAYLSHEVLQ